MLITSAAYLIIQTHELRCFPPVLVYSYGKHQFAQPTAFHSEPVNSNKIKQTNPVIKKLTHNEAAPGLFPHSTVKAAHRYLLLSSAVSSQTLDAKSLLAFLHRVHAGDVADVSEVRSASIFRFEVCSTVSEEIWKSKRYNRYRSFVCSSSDSGPEK
jgi:hypothetical protein